jgi:hypothetical protein
MEWKQEEIVDYLATRCRVEAIVEPFDQARDLYAAGKRLLDATRDAAVTNDALRWAREDLEDVLLDLKLAVIELNVTNLNRLIFDTNSLLNAVWREVKDEGD